MRMGGKRIDWTLDEVAYLLDSAGRVPLREICRHLRRSSESVRHMARRLREQGHAISLRHFEPRTAICPSCGRSSATARDPQNRTGICRPCQLRRQLASIESQTAGLMGRLPAEERATYEQTEAETGARTYEPRPRAPRLDATATYYQRMRAEESHDIALEQWETRRMEREVKAAQKRKERIARKLRNCQN